MLPMLVSICLYTAHVYIIGNVYLLCKQDGCLLRKRGLVMNIDALSAEEGAYLLGLYLADGSSRWRSKSTKELSFGLQWDEGEIAKRVADMLGCCGLNPHIYPLRRTRMTVVYAVGVNIGSFFPVKKEVKGLGDNSALRRVVDGGFEVPFIAGLVDGDGSATVKLQHHAGSLFGKRQVQVFFSQSNFQFLVDFVYEYVNGLVPRGATLVDDKEAKAGVSKRVSILARGRDALIHHGILRWSFKFARLTNEVERVRREVAELKSKYVTLRKLADRLGLGNSTVWRWCKEGKLRHTYVRSPLSKRRATSLLVSVEEAQRIELEVSEVRERVKTIKEGGVKLRGVAKMLGVTSAALCQRYRRGELQATLIHERGSKCLVIPRVEVEHLKETKQVMNCPHT
jgi:DNA invertase Pin-like site-specific DNA recombinase